MNQGETIGCSAVKPDGFRLRQGKLKVVTLMSGVMTIIDEYHPFL